MYECLYVCIYVRMYLCMFLCMWVRTYLCMNVYTRVYECGAHPRMHVCVLEIFTLFL